MISFASIKENIVNDIDYGCRASSLIVLVPGLSLLVQKVQTAHLFDAINRNPELQASNVDLTRVRDIREVQQLDTVYISHTIGSFIQMVALVSLVGLNILNPLFYSVALVAGYELLSCVRGLSFEMVTYNALRSDNIQYSR